MEGEKVRLKKLVEHWADHNDEHTARIEESARKAAEMGLKAAAEALRDAAEVGRNVSIHLRRAEENIE